MASKRLFLSTCRSRWADGGRMKRALHEACAPSWMKSSKGLQ